MLGFERLRGRSHRGQHDRRVPGNRGGNRRRRAVEGDMHDVEAERQPQHLAQQMALRPHPAGRVTVFAGISFDQRDELFEIARRQRRIDDNDVERSDRQRDRSEVSVGIEREFGEQRRVDDEGAKRNEQRVAVGRCAGRLRRADIAGRAGDVLDIELLAEMLGEFLRSKARENVGRAAGLKRHDDAHWPRRPGLRPRAARERRERGGARQQLENLSTRMAHRASLARGLISFHDIKQHMFLRSRGAFFAAGFCFFASRTPRRGGRSAESRSGACEAPVGPARNAAGQALARRLASFGGRSPPGAPPWRF